MNDIKQTYEIAGTPAQVWRALTEPRIIEEWSGASATFPLQVGAAYLLWDGTIGGEIVEIVPQQKLVQTWKPQDWTRTDSIVTFMLMPQGSGTRVDLHHVNVEESDFDGTTEGWDLYYLGAIKRLLEGEAPEGAGEMAPAPAKRTRTAKRVVKKTAVRKTATREKTVAKKTPAKKKPVARSKTPAARRRKTTSPRTHSR